MSFEYSESLNLLVNPQILLVILCEFRLSNKILFSTIPEEQVRVWTSYHF